MYCRLICNDRNLQESPYALNEIAVLKRDSSSMISIRTAINGAYLNTYQADGLVIATPTGSTAYSLSVGGPIIVPHSNTIAITPVAPHSLNVRPIVIRDDWEITLDVESRSHNFLVAIDGSSETCKETTQPDHSPGRLQYKSSETVQSYFLRYPPQQDDVGSGRKALIFRPDLRDYLIPDLRA